MRIVKKEPRMDVKEFMKEIKANRTNRSFTSLENVNRQLSNDSKCDTSKGHGNLYHSAYRDLGPSHNNYDDSKRSFEHQTSQKGSFSYGFPQMQVSNQNDYMKQSQVYMMNQSYAPPPPQYCYLPNNVPMFNQSQTSFSQMMPLGQYPHEMNMAYAPPVNYHYQQPPIPLEVSVLTIDNQDKPMEVKKTSSIILESIPKLIQQKQIKKEQKLSKKDIPPEIIPVKENENQIQKQIRNEKNGKTNKRGPRKQKKKIDPEKPELAIGQIENNKTEEQTENINKKFNQILQRDKDRISEKRERLNTIALVIFKNIDEQILQILEKEQINNLTTNYKRLAEDLNTQLQDSKRNANLPNIETFQNHIMEMLSCINED